MVVLSIITTQIFLTGTARYVSIPAIRFLDLLSAFIRLAMECIYLRARTCVAAWLPRTSLGSELTQHVHIKLLTCGERLKITSINKRKSYKKLLSCTNNFVNRSWVYSHFTFEFLSSSNPKWWIRHGSVCALSEYTGRALANDVLITKLADLDYYRPAY